MELESDNIRRQLAHGTQTQAQQRRRGDLVSALAILLRAISDYGRDGDQH